EGADTVAAFIAEPIQGSGGVIVPQLGEITRRRDDDAAGSLDRFSDDRGDRVGALGQDRFLDSFGGPDPGIAIAGPAIRIRWRDLQELRHRRAEHLVVGWVSPG